MADNSIGAVKICTDTLFILRVKILLTSLVAGILAEDRAVPFHNTRARWAARFSSRSVIDVEKACMIVAFAPGVDSDSEDRVILQVLRSHVNVLAGAFNPAVGPVDGTPQEVIIEEVDHDNNPNTPPRTTRTFKNIFGLLR